LALIAQDTLVGPNKKVSKSLIRLHIKSCDVPDLTLIDLPGITRIATNGQQEDASEIVRWSLIFKKKKLLPMQSSVLLCIEEFDVI